MKKKIIALCLVICLLAIAVVGGTMAYLTDDDAATNVMTVGKIDIIQNEQERDENGALDDFTQDKMLYPAVFPDGASYLQYADPADYPVANDEAWKVVVDNPNVIDKFVTVTNEGNTAAYIRTIIGYEGNAEYGPEGAHIHVVHNSQGVTIKHLGVAKVDNVDYTFYSYTYTAALPKDETSVPSLKQIYMNKNVTSEIAAYYGEKYDVLVFTQAVQAAGFDNAETALVAGFGEATAAKAADWFVELTTTP